MISIRHIVFYLLFVLILTIFVVNGIYANETRIMYGFKGMNGLFDTKAFEQYARIRGYKPVIIKAWPTNSAIYEFTKYHKPKDNNYIIYGYSLGVQTGRNLILKGYRPKEFVAVGPYFKVVNIDKLPVKTTIYGDASSIPKYPYLKYPKTKKPVNHGDIMKQVLYVQKEKIKEDRRNDLTVIFKRDRD